MLIVSMLLGILFAGAAAVVAYVVASRRAVAVSSEQAVQGARNVADLVKQGVDATGRTTRIAQDLQSAVSALTEVTRRFKVERRD